MSKAVIEIGSHWGVDSYDLIKKYTPTPLFAVEPAPRNVERLRTTFNNWGTMITILPLAIDLENGVRTLHLAEHGDYGCSSLHSFNPDIKTLWTGRDDFIHTSSVRVPCITGAVLVDMIKATEIEYLWIDAQGNDFRILRSFGEDLHKVKEGRCETALTVSLYQEDNDSENVEKYLQAHGFKTRVEPDNVNKECDVHFWR